MAIPSRQIGWSTKSNLLWQISKQLEALSGIMYNRGSQPPTPVNSCDASNLNLEQLLTNMNSCYTQVTSWFPTITYFTDYSSGDGITSINDGCSDMYDGGNLFNTNLTQTYNQAKWDDVNFEQSIPYTHTQDTENQSCNYTNPPMDGQIVSGTGIFNTASTTCSKYFTNMYPGMFMLAATGMNVAQFGIYGNLGSDGQSVVYNNLSSTNYPDWKVYYKVNNDNNGTGDPNVTHIMLVYGDINNVAQVVDCAGSWDDDVLVGLSSVNTAVITIVFATAAGESTINDSDAVVIADAILDVYNGIGCSPEPTTTTTTTTVNPLSLFKATFDTNITGPGAVVELPYENQPYTGTINWGDGTITANSYATRAHTYVDAGIYQIVIDGNITYWNPYYKFPIVELTSIDQFGTNFSFGDNLGGYLGNCPNLTSIASDIPLAGITRMSSMFYGSSSFNGDISAWDVSGVTNMYEMFHNATSFNGNISTWNVSNVTVTEMGYMFQNAASFNQDLSGWCVTNIPTEPTDFATGATSWVLPKPVWGTCP